MFNSVSNKKNKNFFTIGGKLLVYILFASSAVTTILTMGVFYFDYQEEKANLNEIEKNLRENTAVGIGEAVFLLNESAIKSQVDGLSNVVDIVEIKVTDEDKNLIYEVSKRKAIESDDVIEVKLVSGKEYENQFAGWMYATITYENMHARILKRVVVFFVTQFLKTLALSFVILLIIYNILTKHINKVAGYLEKRDYTNVVKTREISLDRKSVKRDELDILVDKLNMFDQKIVELNLKNSEENKELDRKRQLAEAQALHSAKMATIGEVAAGIAHEINNPLAIINGYAQSINKSIVRKNIQGAETEVKQLDKIKNMVNRISKITNGMLIFAREDVQEIPAQKVKAREVLEDVSYMYEQRVKTKHIDLIQPDEIPDEWEVFCKLIPVGQVLYNLVSNAVDAIEQLDEKWIKIEVKEIEDEIEFSVTDSGNGISKEDQEKIFQPFFTTKPVGVGTGLGLAISQGTLQDHDSELMVDNECENTKFYFRLKKIS